MECGMPSTKPTLLAPSPLEAIPSSSNLRREDWTDRAHIVLKQNKTQESTRNLLTSSLFCRYHQPPFCGLDYLAIISNYLIPWQTGYEKEWSPSRATFFKVVLLRRECFILYPPQFLNLHSYFPILFPIRLLHEYDFVARLSLSLRHPAVFTIP